MKRVLLLIHLVFSLLITCEGQTTTVVQKVDRWYWHSREMNEMSMSQSERREVITELRRRLPLGDQTDQGRYRFLLLRLGDQQTIAELLKDIRSDDRKKIDNAMGAFANINDLALIPVLAELLYYPEKPEWIMPLGTDVGCYTRPEWAAVRLLNLITGGTEFSQEVKGWIITQNNLGRHYQAICLLWEENKEAFLRRDYAAVKAPQTAIAVMPSFSTNVLSAAVPPTQAASKVVAPLVVTPSRTETRSKDWTTLRTVGVVLLALGTIGIIVWRLKRR